MIGRTLSHYKVLEEISRGGVGIVYKALDVKLNREVALKVLPPELVADPDRKRRFVQEAQAAAACFCTCFFGRLVRIRARPTDWSVSKRRAYWTELER